MPKLHADWQQHFAATRTTAAEAIARIPRGKHVFIASGAAEPVPLVEELVRQAERFADNVIVHLLTLGPAPYVEPRYEGRFRHNAFFIGGNVREAVHAGRADYTPVFLSRIPRLIRSRRMPIDVALIQTKIPDRQVLLRPIRVTDQQKLTDLFYNLSDDTIYKRWMRAVHRVPRGDVLEYLDVDYDKKMALVIELEHGEQESELIGMGRYTTDPATSYADVAFLIRDDWQCQGLGTVLRRELLDYARDHGVQGFTAQVLATNGAMMQVFHRTGLRIHSHLAEGVHDLVIPLAPEEKPPRAAESPAVRATTL